MTLPDCEKVICGYFGDMHPNCLKSKSRIFEITLARDLFCYYCFYKAGLTVLSVAIHLELSVTTVRNTIAVVHARVRPSDEGARDNVYTRHWAAILKIQTP